MSPIKRPAWQAAPLLVAYLVVVSATVGLLVSRNPEPTAAVAAVGGQSSPAEEHEQEAAEPPLWLELFRPSPPTAARLLQAGLPSLPFRRQQEERSLLIFWTGRAGERPQTLFQVVFPFLRPESAVAHEPPAPGGTPGQTGSADQADSPGQAVSPGQAASPGPSPSPGATPGRSTPSGPAGTTPRPGGAEPAAERLRQPERAPIEVLNGGLPLVGIYHTHDWESYISEFPDLLVADEDDLIAISSYDHSERTVVDIGEALAHRLRDLGVTTVHAPFSHQDRPYDYAYQSSRETARKILRAAPSVKILLDLHRDGTWGLDSTTMVDGEPVARLRCVIGARSDQPHWEQNKRFCDALMERLEKLHPGLTLPTLLKDARFNQDLLPGALLIEVGNATNTYDEAERAVGYLAEALVQLIREGAYPH